MIVVGAVKEAFFRNKIEMYAKEISKKYTFELVELPDRSIPKNAKETIKETIKEEEGVAILGRINPTDYVVALCIEGKMTDEQKLQKLVQNIQTANQLEQKNVAITFIIGGSLGLSDKVVKRADYRLSFSKMTFPHQLMRVMLLEQLAQL